MTASCTPYVIEDILETPERLPRAGTVGGIQKPGIAGTLGDGLLHGCLVQTVEHLVPEGELRDQGLSIQSADLKSSS